jgi:hypothetical protein
MARNRLRRCDIFFQGCTDAVHDKPSAPETDWPPGQTKGHDGGKSTSDFCCQTVHDPRRT